jgi:hypothetical protein
VSLKRRKTMKKLPYILSIISVALFASCSSTYHAGTNQDDVYYSSKTTAPAQPQTYPATPPAAPSDYSGNNTNSDNSSYNSQQQDDYTQPESSSSSSYSDGQGNTYVTNNYYDDYYSYEYSSRMRRFYNPVYGVNYYDPFYTNQYWYDYSPASWGVSIYLGYNWWAPSYFYYSPFCYGGFGMSYGIFSVLSSGFILGWL